MNRGRKPTPTSLRVLHGNPGHRPLPEDEPDVRVAIPTCPRELSPTAKKEWRRIAPELARLGLLARIDRAALAMYCDHYGRWLEAIAALQRYGVVIKSPSGFLMQSPYVAIANKSGEQVRLLLSEFGMSPSSRTRVHAEPVIPKDDAFELWERRGRQA
jgi:P27 family predicted phage terminase small subunit